MITHAARSLTPANGLFVYILRCSCRDGDTSTRLKTVTRALLLRLLILAVTIPPPPRGLRYFR
ncbi:hypothetical protein KCP69_13100 [Salmonella enterica subsp. enterica]|nr:hypothetical protein KCP69_13100 [Salmonella enterica subsp. enterica]